MIRVHCEKRRGALLVRGVMNCPFDEDVRDGDEISMERVFHEHVRTRLTRRSGGTRGFEGSTFNSSHPMLEPEWGWARKPTLGSDPVTEIISGPPDFVAPQMIPGPAKPQVITNFWNDESLYGGKHYNSMHTAVYSLFAAGLLLVACILVGDFLSTMKQKKGSSAVSAQRLMSAAFPAVHIAPKPEIAELALLLAPAAQPQFGALEELKTESVDGDFDKQFREGPGSRPALATMAINCDLRGARRLLNSGTAIDEVDSHGETALAWAAKHDCIPVARLLIERGADMHRMADNGLTPFLWAKWFHNFKLVEIMADSAT